MGKIIELHNVFKSYGKNKVLEEASFTLEEGKFITLIGSNGAGKSTTLRLLTGIESTDEGSVKVFGQDPYSFDFGLRSDLFFIHENYALTFPYNLLETIKIYREVFPRWSDKIFNQHLKARKFSLKKQFSNLSRGQKMQFLLMMALAAQPKVLFLDEITSVIDIEGQRYFLEELKKFTEEGGTVVITTNILSELNDYTDHLILLQETKVMVNCSIDQLKKDFFILKRREDHAIFQHERVYKVRKDNDGKELYLVPSDVLIKMPDAQHFKVEQGPRLEDILVSYFQTREESLDEQLVV